MESKKITIGRDKKCDLVIEDIPQNAKVSGRHATITEMDVEDPINRTFILEDYSTNGTYVNSQFIHNGTYKIQEGDTITLGRDYVLDWDLVLSFFEGTKTDRRPIGKKTVVKPQNDIFSNNGGFISADPVYPDPLPVISNEPGKPIIDDESEQSDGKKFVFTPLHWLITIGAAVIGFVLGILVN
jgi:pSer/pThr/pTyr-binding forkhead associated (FHA) protein